MSSRWEKSIEDWYAKSHTVGLEYLDLASAEKVTHKDLAHNIGVIFDRLSLHSRVIIKNQKEVQETLISLDSRVSSLEKQITSLKKTVTAHPPLTKQEVQKLVEEVSEQPKLVEQHALELTSRLDKKIDRLEELIGKLCSWVSS